LVALVRRERSWGGWMGSERVVRTVFVFVHEGRVAASLSGVILGREGTRAVGGRAGQGRRLHGDAGGLGVLGAGCG